MWHLLTTLQEGGQGTCHLLIHVNPSFLIQFLRTKHVAFSDDMISWPAVVQWVAAAVPPRQSQGTCLLDLNETFIVRKSH